MLLTRCPSCRTRFRLTADALHEAGGQVRCGRCSAVFSAYEELGEADAIGDDAQALAAPEEKEGGAAVAATFATQPAAATPELAPAEPDEHLGAAAAQGAESPSAQDAESASARAADFALDDIWLAEVLAEIERGDAGDEDDADADPAAGAITPEQVEAVLEQHPERSVPVWQMPARVAEPRATWWRYGSAIAVALLAVQAVHYFRADLASNGVVGAFVQSAYGVFGATVVPVWDVQQYRIMDWSAAAEANAQGRGRLNITARIHNRGPDAQPYPYVHLQLKDRWERTVGSRIFAPEDYLPSEVRDTRSMVPGTTALARLEVVDPGSDAYGFELDVCVEAAGGTLNCAADAIFRHPF